MRILASNAFYLPGFKAGGPIRSIANLVEQLGTGFEMRIVTGDRDSGDQSGYPDRVPMTWMSVGAASVLYVPPSQSYVRLWWRLLRAADFDVLYLNSAFSANYTLIPLLLRWIGVGGDKPVVLAPRGEFSPGAIAIKSAKKWLFLVLSRWCGLFNRVTWQASTDTEAEYIRQWFGRGVCVVVAPNIVTPASSGGVPQRAPKQRGRLKLVFLSRISRKKNLIGALQMVSQVGGDIDFHVYGSISDRSYWQECQACIDSMPSRVRVEYRGALDNRKVGAVLGSYDLLVLPTWGENFGHVIVEALRAGCPVLVSDQTPWRGLADAGVGWDCDLKAPDQFITAMRFVQAMDEAEHVRLRVAARDFALRHAEAADAVEKHRELFVQAAARTSR